MPRTGIRADPHGLLEPLTWNTGSSGQTKVCMAAEDSIPQEIWEESTELEWVFPARSVVSGDSL